MRTLSDVVSVSAGGGNVSVNTGGPLQRNQEAMLRRVPRAVTSDRCRKAEEQADPLDHTENLSLIHI